MSIREHIDIICLSAALLAILCVRYFFERYILCSPTNNAGDNWMRRTIDGV